MLPVLLKLLHMPTVLEQVPAVLTALLQRSPAMQKAANDSDAVSSLTTILHHDHTWHNRPRFKASTSQQRLPAFLSSTCVMGPSNHGVLLDVILLEAERHHVCDMSDWMTRSDHLTCCLI